MIVAALQMTEHTTQANDLDVLRRQGHGGNQRTFCLTQPARGNGICGILQESNHRGWQAGNARAPSLVASA